MELLLEMSVGRVSFLRTVIKFGSGFHHYGGNSCCKLKTLRGGIIESLKHSEMVPYFKDVLYSTNKYNNPKIIVRDEGEYWDFKQDFTLNDDQQIASLAKDVLAFHNTNGGAIIFGIEDKTHHISGLYQSQIVDRKQLLDKLKRYVSNDVEIFLGQIPIPNATNPSKYIWIVFVKKYVYRVSEVRNNGPEIKGKICIKKGDYYVRIQDESKKCVEARDFEVLFRGHPPEYLHAYEYSVNEPYFRLLAPHCKQFFWKIRHN